MTVSFFGVCWGFGQPIRVTENIICALSRHFPMIIPLPQKGSRDLILIGTHVARCLIIYYILSTVGSSYFSDFLFLVETRRARWFVLEKSFVWPPVYNRTSLAKAFCSPR